MLFCVVSQHVQILAVGHNCAFRLVMSRQLVLLKRRVPVLSMTKECADESRLTMECVPQRCLPFRGYVDHVCLPRLLRDLAFGRPSAF